MTEIEKYEKLIEIGWIYDKDNGLFYNSKGLLGGSISQTGYLHLQLRVDKSVKHIRAHRFAWFYIHGEAPEIIDHIDGNKLNNKLTNLRSTTKSINCHNKVLAKGYTKRGDKYVAHIKENGKFKQLGRFDTQEEAMNCYKEYKKQIGAFI